MLVIRGGGMLGIYRLNKFLRERKAQGLIADHCSRLDIEVTRHVESTRGMSLIHRERMFLSQYGEGGLVASLLDEFGTDTGPILEFGFSIYENNSIATALASDRVAHYIDGSEYEVKRAQSFLAKQGLTHKMKVHNAFITASNINDIILACGLCGEIDYLSIDIDGNDYWVWKAIKGISPRVVSVEYNASFGPFRRVTVPYIEAFDRHEFHPSGLRHGASYMALLELGAVKGYTCLGADSTGLNLYFVRSDLLPGDHNINIAFGEVMFRPHIDRLMRGIGQYEQELIALSDSLTYLSAPDVIK